MEISNKNYILLKKIVDGDYTSIKDVGESRSKIIYNMKKINEYLISFDLPKIELVNDSFVVSDTLRKNSENVLQIIGGMYFNADERLKIIELLIECEREEIHLKDLMTIFSISKNTAYNDVKEISKSIGHLELDIEYSRKIGYKIKGDELIVRKRIISLVEDLIGNYSLVETIMKILNIKLQEYKEACLCISLIEKELQVHFVESKVNILPLLLSICTYRIKRENTICEDELFFNELNDTFEVKTVSEILDQKYNLVKQENYYLTLLILSTSISKLNYVNSEFKDSLNNSIDEMITDFERNACIIFSERERLQQIILQHMIAAYYRIKYDLTLSKEMIRVIEANKDREEFILVAEILEKSLEPLQKVLQLNVIPLVEKDFLVLQLISWIKRQNLIPLDKYRVIVVCVNGVTISNIMYLSLREIFPEFNFIGVVSKREFDQISDNQYEIVFSTTKVKTNKKLFLVDHIFKPENIAQLRTKVLSELFGFKNNASDIDIVYQTIDTFLGKEQGVRLKSLIKRNIEKDRNDLLQNEEGNLSLSDLLPKQHIRIVNDTTDYLEAMEIVAKPLLDEGLIEKEYVEKIKQNYDPNYPNIIFGEEIAIPHAGPKDGTHGLSMSLVKINNGVYFSKENLIHIVIMLAPKDASSHLTALVQLSELAFDQQLLNKIIKSTKKEEIIDLLSKYDHFKGGSTND